MPWLECSVTGCNSPVQAKGLCHKHYQQKHKAKKKAQQSSSTSKTSKKDPILEQLLVGKMHTVPEPERSPIGMGGPGEKPKDGGSPPPRGLAPQAGTMPVSPGLFLLIGHRMDKTFDTKDFGLDEAEAEYMARILGDAMTAHGATADPMYLFFVGLVLWLVPPLVKHMPEKWKEISKKEGPTWDIVSRIKEEGLLSLPTMTGRRGKKTKKEVPFENTYVEPIPINPEPTPTPLTVNPKWKQTDLVTMEKESKKQLKIST